MCVREEGKVQHVHFMLSHILVFCIYLLFEIDSDTEMQNKNTESESLWLPAEMR